MKVKIIEYNIDKILNHNNQPRKTYTQESIIDLANSIRQFGLLQPIVLSSKHLPFRVIAGQRRLLAYQYLRDNINQGRYSIIPAIVKDDTTDSENLFLALIENLQREELNIIDKSDSFKTLIDNGFAKTHKEIGESLGLSRENVSKIIKISELDYNTKSIARQHNYSNILVLEKLVKAKNSDLLLKTIIENRLSRKDALSLIKDNGNRLPKPEIKLNKRNIFKGTWGKIEITSKQTHLHIDPKKLDDEGQKLLKQLVDLLEKTKEDN